MIITGTSHDDVTTAHINVIFLYILYMLISSESLIKCEEGIRLKIPLLYLHIKIFFLVPRSLVHFDWIS